MKMKAFPYNLARSQVLTACRRTCKKKIKTQNLTEG